MDNFAGSLRAGVLQLSEILGIEALHACIGILYSISFEVVRLEMF